MSANNRIFYACQAVAIGLYQNVGQQPPATRLDLEPVHGVQSVGINTTFNLEQAFELGQISIYENIEGLPDIEVTLEKVLDGYPLIYHLATSGAAFAVPATNSLVGRAKERCNVALGIYDDDQEAVSGVAPVAVLMSGMYVNSLSYTFPTDGNCTESVTLVGNSKGWFVNSSGMSLETSDSAAYKFGGDTPKGSGGVQRREDVVMMSSIMPISIYDVSRVGYTSAGDPTPMVGNNWNASTHIDNGKPLNRPRAHIQNITISTDLGREDILELGHKEPYYRSAAFPVEVTSEFEVIAVSGDFINAYVNGDNTQTTPIRIRLRDGTVFDLGNKNRLSSVNYTGGDAGGGNVSITYSFSTFNDLTITAPSVFNA
jgi:hypothetical protein